jgi:hypothetical protein
VPTFEKELLLWTNEYECLSESLPHFLVVSVSATNVKNQYTSYTHILVLVADHYSIANTCSYQIH